MLRSKLVVALVAGLAAAAAHAGAEGVASRADLTLSLANQLADATLADCHARQRTAVVAVVDRSGQLVSLQRDDNVGPHNTVAAQRKAFTALSTKTPTLLLAERARTNPDAANLTTLDELLLLGGGVPVVVDDVVIGALGVAGAGGGETDQACAQSAINSVFTAH